MEEAKVGDIVVGPVYDAEGKRFLPKGIKLNSALIARLISRGIETVAIEGTDPELLVENASEFLVELDHRFKERGDERMARIKAVARRHLDPEAAPQEESAATDNDAAGSSNESAPAGQFEKYRALIENAQNLPALPDVVLRVNELIESSEASGRQIGTEIAKDQVLSAKVLRLVNSGLYGFAKPISTIPHAVTMLGFDAVKGLVMSSSVLDLMEGAIPGLWEHSQACARTCGLIANYLELPDPEELTTIGLLHDLGKVVLHKTLQAEYAQVLLRVKRADMLFHKAEEEPRVLGPGLNHGTLGAWLLEKWTLPEKLVEPIARHHSFQPDLEYSQQTALVHLADILCRAEAFGNGGDRKIPLLSQEALATLEMDLVDVEEIMDQMNKALRDIPRMIPGLG